jgi:hypothetical protein
MRVTSTRMTNQKGIAQSKRTQFCQAETMLPEFFDGIGSPR